MNLTKILFLCMFFIFVAGNTQIYAHRDLDDRHHSRTEDYNWMCPWCLEGPGYNLNGGMNGYKDYKERYNMEFGKTPPKFEEPLTIDQARFLVDNYIYLLRIPHLKSGEIIEKGNEFNAEIIRMDGSLLETLIIDKQTGVIKSQY